MPLSLTQLFLLYLVYLGILFGSAYAADREWIPRSFIEHPALRILSLGVFVGAIGFYGTTGLAATYGSQYLLYYIGASAAFFIAPALLGPMSRIALAHKLGSLSDIFAFRYPAPWVGGTVTLLMLLGLLPLVALQIDAVVNTVHLLNMNVAREALAIFFCATITLFAVLFGARHFSTQYKHQGIVVAIGIESVIKLAACVIVAVFSVYTAFGGPAEMIAWLNANRPLLAASQEDLSLGTSRILLLMFFAGAVAMPHIYHMLLTENNDERVLTGARWGLPAYLIILSLCVPLVLWAAIKLGADTPPEFHILGIGLASGHQGITLLAFLGGLAAASGVLIVSTLALASMTLNHIVLPFYRPSLGIDFYWLLLNGRRILIAAIIFGGYLMFRLVPANQNLLLLGGVAFVATLQFLPGLVGAFHWRRANKAGLFGGLVAGYLVWFVMMFLPMINGTLGGPAASSAIPGDMAFWQLAALLSITVNVLVFLIFSLIFKPSTDEIAAADICMSDSIVRHYPGELSANSVPEIQQSLATAIGQRASSREVNLALDELSFAMDERRPHALHQIRTQMEGNLSSMMGQTIAHRIIGQFLPFRSAPDASVPEQVHSIEDRLEEYRSRLTGLAAELDRLRRYHRQILQDLPAAVCTLGADQQVLTWNQAMTEVTGFAAERTIGSPVSSLPQWGGLLADFAGNSELLKLKSELEVDGHIRQISLQKAQVREEEGNTVIVIEDITEAELLEQQLLHKERLASIGQLAAGVAHEIGNPVTGIACLAQNLKLEGSQDELNELSDQILEQTDRISTILQSLVNFAHQGTADARARSVPIDIRQCVDEAISLLSLSHKEESISFVNQSPKGLLVTGDPQRLCQVFINILSNARDASKAGDDIRISASLDDETIAVEIVDSGHGISSDDLQHLFEPFYTTKDPGQGTGLGLAIVNSIIQEHFGSISVHPRDDEPGTRVVVRLPAWSRGDPELTSAPDSLFSA